MKTPKEYSDNLKQNIITKDMLVDCLFSVNKRAKNCLDKEQKYREYFRYNPYARDKYGSVESYKEKKIEYYNQKEKLLALVNPTCIHEEATERKRRVYSNQPGFRKLFREGNYIHCGYYYDRKKERYIDFIDLLEPAKAYYLFYDLGAHSFHTPIQEEKLISYPTLDVVKIEQLTTYGKVIGELISTQFVKKVIDLIESGTYTFVDEQQYRSAS